MRREGEDRFLVSRRLFQTHALGNHGIEKLRPEDATDLLEDFFSQRRALVVQRDDDAQDAQARVGPRLDLVDRLEQVVGALEGEVGRLDRDQDVRRGDHRVDRDHPERGRGVDEHGVVGVTDFLDLVAQAEMPVDLARELGLDLGERDPCGRHVQLGDLRGADDLGKPDGGIDQDVVHGLIDRPAVDVGHRAVSLGIEVDEKGLEALLGHRRREVDGRSGLPDTSLLIGNRDDHEPEYSRAYAA